MRYLVVIEETSTRYSAHVPDLPGGISVGESRNEVQQNIQETIIFHIDGLIEDGLQVAKPMSKGVSLLIPKVA